MPTVYILQCEKGRYYIGKTDRPLYERIEEHFGKNGSRWTMKYRPISVVEHISNADCFDEDKYTKIYMKKYGIDKVRGGTYTQIILPRESISVLEKELCSASDLCFRCNRQGHFASQCYARTRADGSPIDDEDDDDNKQMKANLSSLINEGISAISSMLSSIEVSKVVAMEDGNTKLEMSSFAVTKIREISKENNIKLDDNLYKIVNTKRNLGLFAKINNNYVIIEGKHNIIPKKYAISI